MDCYRLPKHTAYTRIKGLPQHISGGTIYRLVMLSDANRATLALDREPVSPITTIIVLPMEEGGVTAWLLWYGVIANITYEPLLAQFPELKISITDHDSLPSLRGWPGLALLGRPCDERPAPDQPRVPGTPCGPTIAWNAPHVTPAKRSAAGTPASMVHARSPASPAPNGDVIRISEQDMMARFQRQLDIAIDRYLPPLVARVVGEALATSLPGVVAGALVPITTKVDTLQASVSVTEARVTSLQAAVVDTDALKADMAQILARINLLLAERTSPAQPERGTSTKTHE